MPDILILKKYQTIECVCQLRCSFAKCQCHQCKSLKKTCVKAPTVKDIMYLFGERLEVTPCFSDHLERLGLQPGQFQNRLNLWQLRTTIVEALQKDLGPQSPFLLQWLRRWDEMNQDGSLTMDGSAEHMQLLFRHLLATGMGGHYFSFCQNRANEQRRYWHCVQCPEPGCRTQELGHCDQCKGCRRYGAGECEFCISDESDYDSIEGIPE